MVVQRRFRLRRLSPRWQSFGIIMLVSLLLLHLTSRSASAGLEGPHTSPAGGDIEDMLIADVNGDGKGDVIALIFDSDKVWVYLGNGEGTFAAGVGYTVGTVQTGDLRRDRLALADLNGDSRLDLIVSTAGSNYFNVLLGTGGGAFGPQTTYPTAGGFNVSGKVEVGRVNGDAFPDLIVSGGTITLYTGNGDGTFTAAPALGLGGGWAKLGDLNGDGKLDIVAMQNERDLNIYLGHGDGTFTATDAQTGPVENVTVELADFNGDGKLDVAVSSNARDTVFLYFGQGNGHVVQEEDTPPAGRVFGRIVVSDVNGDGKPDIVGSCCTGNPPIGFPGTVFVVLGFGDGTFGPPVDFRSVPSVAMAVGRINSDALPDVLVGDIVDHTLTALLNDGPATVQFASAAATVTENAGTTSLAVNRTGGNGPLSVIVNASGGSATQGADYTFTTPQTLTWSTGDFAPKTVQVPILQDQVADGTKTVQFGLSLPAVPTWGVWGALGAQTSTTVTITDDEAPPAVSVANVSVAEGNAGTKLAQFPVTLSGVTTTLPITVAYATTNGSATAGSDYTATSGTLTFSPGTTSLTINVPVIGDTSFEPDEAFTVALSNPTNATLGNAQAIGTIQNDDADAQISLSIANMSVPEGSSGTSAASFAVTRVGSLSPTVTVQYATADGSAKAGSDYTATSGTLTFAPNESTRIIAVPILGDTAVEPDETFTVTLSNPTNATLASAQATGTIQNDDSACSPRPRVTQAVASAGGALTVTISPTPKNDGASNPLQQIVFGAFQNATVTLNGQAVSSGQSVSLPAGTGTADLVVRRTVAGQATTVPITVVDGCGEWKTFVGGGTASGF